MLPCMMVTTGVVILAMKASVAYSSRKNSLLRDQVDGSSPSSFVNARRSCSAPSQYSQSRLLTENVPTSTEAPARTLEQDDIGERRRLPFLPSSAVSSRSPLPSSPRRRTCLQLRPNELDHLPIKRIESLRAVQGHFAERVQGLKDDHGLRAGRQAVPFHDWKRARQLTPGASGPGRGVEEDEEVEKCELSIATRVVGDMRLARAKGRALDAALERIIRRIKIERGVEGERSNRRHRQGAPHSRTKQTMATSCSFLVSRKGDKEAAWTYRKLH